MTSLADWLARLETFSPVEIELGLERVAKALAALKLRPFATTFHVAGTNGKGSSVAMLDAVLRTTGRRVATYTSPHLVNFNERIVVDGRPATDAQIIAAFERVDVARGNLPLTYFEFSTLAALDVFATQNVDIAILEIGLGGRLDAVNAVAADAAIITNIALDHCEWLGNSRDAIAREKAGIMRKDQPVVFASADAPAAIAATATDVGAQLVQQGQHYHYQLADGGWRWWDDDLSLQGLALPALPGSHQLENAAGVIALLKAAGFERLLTPAVLNDAFAALQLPGRMQRIRAERDWLLDVAHNPAAAAALAETLLEQPVSGETVAIIGMLNDKDIAGVVTPLLPLVDRWVAVAPDNARAVPVEELAREIANLSGKACLESASLDDAIAFVVATTAAADRCLVTGSFFVAGPALQALRLYSDR